MFTSLRTRLLATYAIILALSLVLTSVILTLVLRARPVAAEEINVRLVEALDNLLQRQVVVIPPAGPTRLQETGLNALARTLRLRNAPIRIFVTRSDWTVSYDSERFYRDGSRLEVLGAPQPLAQSIQDNVTYPMVQGTLRSREGAEWFFVMQAPDEANPRAQLLMMASKAPNQLTTAEILNAYGEDILGPLLQAGVLGLLIAFVLSVIVTRSVARPLQEVAKTAAIVARGQLDQRAPVTGPREVRTVAEAFNHMTEEVAATQNAQRDFMANVTHDLRTPLTSIQGFSQAIIEGVASDPAAAQRAAQIIHDEAGRLNRMVEELLDLARIEAGRFSMTRNSVRLDEILRVVGERLAPRASEKGIGLTVDVPVLPHIAGDGDRLVQIYTNLVDNAIKHTPSKGSVTLRAAPENQGVLSQVCDTGEGIPSADLPRVFDRFYQVDKSRQSGNRHGAGLGLTIARQIVEAHGGKIWAESTLGVGTTFYIWFPALAPDSTTITRRRTGVLKAPSSK